MANKQLFTFSPILKGETIKKMEVSAVFLVGFIDKKIVATRNERGWDIPGGHLEEEEELVDGLRREAKEEAGVFFTNAIPFARLFMPNKNKCMVFFASNSCTLGDFIQKPDIFERDLLSVETFIERYYGDKDLLLNLIQKAKESFK